MTSPPLTNREYAYFHISGQGTHEAISELLGLKASESWNAGDLSPQNGRPCKFMRWILSSDLDDTHPMSEHIEALLLVLNTRADALRKLWVDFDLTLQCVGYFPPSGHGFHLDREQIRQAARLGLALDLDFYYVDDHGHEV